MSYTINENVEENFAKAIAKIPMDTEILNIECLVIPKGACLDNLPCTLEEVNIGTIYKRNIDLVRVSEDDPVDRIEILRQIFPKRPFGCKFYIMDKPDDYVLPKAYYYSIDPDFD
jgi:hypothetical protein